MELDEHHMWKDQTWLVGSSPTLPLKLGMSEGSLRLANIMVYGVVYQLAKIW